MMRIKEPLTSILFPSVGGEAENKGNAVSMFGLIWYVNL
jgi:hypothetical protein